MAVRILEVPNFGSPNFRGSRQCGNGENSIGNLQSWSRGPFERNRGVGSGAGSLVERFDTELFSDFSAKSSNFRRLVLSCINADFCVQGRIFQHFSSSTFFSFAPFQIFLIFQDLCIIFGKIRCNSC